MTKFTIALREIGTYKEVLRSQVKYYVVCAFEFFVVATDSLTCIFSQKEKKIKKKKRKKE